MRGCVILIALLVIVIVALLLEAWYHVSFE